MSSMRARSLAAWPSHLVVVIVDGDDEEEDDDDEDPALRFRPPPPREDTAKLQALRAYQNMGCDSVMKAHQAR